jgi:2-polyprenyl-6-hydroxyphenyl methylase/3-demethylubiquinone-9 3-methyltransferase
MPSRDYYQQLWEAVPEGLAPDRFALRSRFLLAHISAGQSVLDVGCGEGWFSAELARAGARVVALDVAEEPLRRARARVPGLDARLIEGEAGWPSADASFDVVWAGEVIEHVADTAAWLSELRRVLRPAGLVLLSTPAYERLARLRLALSARAFAEHMDPRGEHLRFYSRATLTRLLCEFRFERVEVRSSRGVLLASAVRSRF